ncbi:MAG: NmrA family NAD(P)-binding protein [Gammaproteobacteria bacterium]
MNAPSLVLVTGATGAQGGAAARALLRAGIPVRILARNPDAPAARALAALGAQVARGDFDDPASLDAACAGAGGAFLVPLVGRHERRYGRAFVEAARRAGIAHLVHTSVCGTNVHRSFPRWGTGYWYEDYWTAKWDVEEMVRNAGFARWTVLCPAFLADNFIPPKVDSMFPDLRRGEIVTAMRADTVLQMTSAADVGAFACAAFTRAGEFAGQNIDLAAEAPTIAEIAATLGRVLGRDIRAITLAPDEVRARGQNVGWVRSQEWTNEFGYRASIPALARYGVPLLSLADWTAAHRAEFVFD